jgi:Mn-dependent DtxR family transcriptional regulator
LWELYLVTFADVAPSHVDWSADLVEHVLPRQLVDELEAALDGDTALKSAPV